MHPNIFKCNQYNWLGQKMLAQHRYSEIIWLKNHLSALRVACIDSEGDNPQRLTNEHLNYIEGLSLMKTSTKLNELIVTLQNLDIQKNNQYFLLLCQCLLYVGNHEAIIALCRQLLNKEIDIISGGSRDSLAEIEAKLVGENEQPKSSASSGKVASLGQLHEMSEESVEFVKLFDNVNRNRLINDPRLWNIFARCLKLQLRFSDADFAQRMACKLTLPDRAERVAHRSSPASRQSVSASGILIPLSSSENEPERDEPEISSSRSKCRDEIHPATLSNFNLPHKEYSEFCITRRGQDFKSALKILGHACAKSQVDHTIHPQLALVLAAKKGSNSVHFKRATDIISALDAHFESSQNPSYMYNHLAIKCKQKLLNIYQQPSEICNNTFGVPGAGLTDQTGGYNGQLFLFDRQTKDELQLDLNYMLIKSYVIINSLVQSSKHNKHAYKSSMTKSTSGAHHASKNAEAEFLSHIDKLIEFLRRSNSSIWQSPSLWNNLGVCYLMKRRYVASLSCLLKARQLNPLDWRIQANLGLASLHVSVNQRSVISLIAAQNFEKSHWQAVRSFSMIDKASEVNHQDEPLTRMLLAISLSELGATYQSRRVFAEMVVNIRKSGATDQTLVAPIVNYLLFLTKHRADESDERLIIRLLDFLEQAWLRRNQNDPQFNDALLELATSVAGTVFRSAGGQASVRKTYAWMKES